MTRIIRQPNQRRGAGRSFFCCAKVLLGCSLFPTMALAAEPPPEPILRIEAGSHTSSISSWDSDSEDRYIVTSSMDDQTVRVWNRQNGELLKTLRPPLYTGGQSARAVALSPDGNLIACNGVESGDAPAPVGAAVGAGATIGKAAASKAAANYALYVFERQSGRMIKRISDNTPRPEAMNLSFSQDGRYLAVALGDRARVHRIDDGKLMLEDRSGYSRSVGFDNTGRFVTVFPGSINLYDRSFLKIATQKPTRQADLHESCEFAAFSPDGAEIAVILRETNSHTKRRIAIVSGRNLEFLRFIDTATAAPVLQWLTGDSDQSALLRKAWVDASTFDGRHNSIAALSARYVEITRKTSATRLRYGNAKEFLVSADVDRVHVTVQNGNGPVELSVAERLVSTSVARDINWQAPTEAANGLELTGVGSYKPKINGREAGPMHGICTSGAVAPARCWGALCCAFTIATAWRSGLHKTMIWF